MNITARYKLSMFLGNAFEHYDNALIALLSPFIAGQFFPGTDPLVALISTYAMIPLAMAIRPFGALFFGYIGDKFSRTNALYISLYGMAIVTGCMAFIPVYQQVGSLAPILLWIGRVAQNFFTSGESIGGAIYLLEHSPEEHRNKMSSYFNASTVAGVLVASLGISLLSFYDFMENGWRILYIFGSFTALFGAILRNQNASTEKPLATIPFSSFLKTSLKTCWQYREKVFIISVVSGFTYASYILALVMINGLIPLVSQIDRTQTMYLNTIMLIIDFLLLIFLGLIIDRFSAKKIMITAGLTAFISGIPLFWLLPDASYNMVIFIRFAFVLIGVCFFAPFHTWSQKLIPKEHRYTIISFAYAFGAQLFGGVTAVISLKLYESTGWITSAAWYWMLLGLFSSYLILRQKKSFSFAAQN